MLSLSLVNTPALPSPHAVLTARTTYSGQTATSSTGPVRPDQHHARIHHHQLGRSASHLTRVVRTAFQLAPDANSSWPSTTRCVRPDTTMISIAWIHVYTFQRPCSSALLLPVSSTATATATATAASLHACCDLVFRLQSSRPRQTGLGGDASLDGPRVLDLPHHAIPWKRRIWCPWCSMHAACPYHACFPPRAPSTLPGSFESYPWAFSPSARLTTQHYSLEKEYQALLAHVLQWREIYFIYSI